jgi:diketogulonate reductase-like aldo/keto reductase
MDINPPQKYHGGDDDFIDLTKSATPLIGKRKRFTKDCQSIPLMGFGTYDISDPNVLTNALKIGYRHFDLADSYINLEEMKPALTSALRPVEDGGLGIERDEIWLTMKVSTLNFKSHFNIRTPEGHIRRLLALVGTEYFDLVLYHHPREFFASRESLIMAWSTMTGLPNTIVRRVGVSNYYIPHITRLLNICDDFNMRKPYANQIQINPYIYQSERDLINLCSLNGIALIAYSPLGFNMAKKLLGDPTLLGIAQEIEVTPAQLVLSWLLSKNICVIPKSNSYERQQENFKSCVISVATVAPFLSEIDNLSKEERVVEERVVFLGYKAIDAKKNAAEIEEKWT